MVGLPKKSVTSSQSPRLIRGCCSIGRGQKCVVFLKIIFQLQPHGAKVTTHNPMRGIVTQPELTCKELTHLITDYLEERLSQVDRIRFEQHLSGCPGCVAYLKQMRVTIHAIASKPALTIPPDLESSLLNAFRRWKNPND